MRLLGFHYFVKKSKNVKLIQNQAKMFMKCRNTRNSETGGRELKKKKSQKSRVLARRIHEICGCHYTV